MAVKLENSHKYLANGIYLLEQCKKSTAYLSDETNAKKLLSFLVCIYEVMMHFTHVYFGYEYPHSINTFASDISQEIKKSLSLQIGGYENYKSLCQCSLA